MSHNLSRIGAAVLALTASAAVAAPPASAVWQNLDQRAIDVVFACRDGIRFEGGIAKFEGTPSPASDYRATFKMAMPAPADGVWSDSNLVARQSIVIPKLPKPVTVPRGDDPASTITLSHRGRYLVPVAAPHRPLPLGEAAVTIESINPNDPKGSTSVQVDDCYLYAPVDIVPGSKANKVTIGRGTVVVALKSTSYLRADKLKTSSFRFGPKQAPPVTSRIQDVDGDGRRDLVLTFTTSKTGLTCSTKQAALVGKTASGGRIEGRDKVVPTRC